MAKTSNVSNGMWSQTLARAWNDESFRQELLGDAGQASGEDAAALPKYAKEIPSDEAIPCICIC